MHKRAFVLAAITALAVMIVAPATASALVIADTPLVNDYGLTFAGQGYCTTCHPQAGQAQVATTVHSRFMASGVNPTPPAGTSFFQSQGQVGMQVPYSSIAFTLGDFTGGAATEYLTFEPSSTNPAANPFQIVEGLEWSPVEGWVTPKDSTGLYKGAYCGARCHTLGAQKPGTGKTIPNTNIKTQPTAATADTWARVSTDTAVASLTDLNTYKPGASIQCENCHGTGIAATASQGGHWNTGTKIADRTKLLKSEVCGQCHVTSANVAGTLGTVGYTPDQTLSKFIDISASAIVPTEASYTANPSAYKFYPNGDNKGLHHSFFNEWSMSAHSRRAQLNASSADASVYQKTGAGHYLPTSNPTTCGHCHTGEGYLVRKGAAVMKGFVESTATSGFLGQECVTCHDAHPQAVGAEYTVREPEQNDPAHPSTSICEDCHNWQKETDKSGALVPTTGTRAVSHPTKQVYEGYGAFEVPAAGQFMPGAKCENCHMPITHETRASHSMKPMLPGDALAWNVKADATLAPGNNGDSCSKCHAGETLTQLQANIDSWQSTAAALSADVISAMNAAKSRPETQTAAGTYLLAVANTNNTFYTGEGSMGAHNPPYIQAFLKKGAQLAKSIGGTFAVVTGPSSAVAPGTMTAIAGKIVNGDATGAAQGKLTLLANGVAAGTTASDDSGNFAFTVAPSATTVYTVRWERSSNAATWVTSSVRTVTVTGSVTPPPTGVTATSISINISATTGRVRVPFVLSGTITPAIPSGELVKVYFKKSLTDYWHYSSARVVYGSSQWWYRYTPLVTGARYFKAVYPGDANFAASESGVVHISIR